MLEKNYDKLVTEFPDLIRDRTEVSIGDGWFQILYDLCKSIQRLVNYEKEEERGHYYFIQIKEKFGGARFYMSYETPEMSKEIREAEEKAYKTCEYCGDPGEMRKRSWLKTLCTPCNDKDEAMYKGF